mgnify:FL=1|jgi:hypothetical protein
MTTDQQRSTNGRVKVEQAITGAREAMQASQKGRVRPRKLLVPVLLALGVIFVLRRFEQSTGG